MKSFIFNTRRRLFTFLLILGPAIITAMADNDAAGIATYSQAGAKLGYPILFVLVLITILLGITQEMGMRLALVSRKGLADLIRENYGLKISVAIFACLFLANMGSITANVSAIKVTSQMFGVPSLPSIIVLVVVASLLVVRGNYKINQNIMLIVSLFFLSYVFSAIRAKPDWGLALTNLVFPHGVELNNEYIKNYLLITMGVLGTTITPWGQFFISSFAFDKHIDAAKLKYSQLETYFGAFLTDFFSFFMIVATAATLFINRVVLESGEQAAMAIKPFAGEMAGFIYAFGILNAGIMGMIIISLSTAYAFSEFFGFTGSLDVSYGKGKLFYGIFLFQIIFASLLALLPNISLFSLALVTQTVNAIMLPLVFYFLINLTNNPKIMGSHTNSAFQRNFGYIASGIIIIASIITFIFMIFSN